jgi:RimJ/RimL family protein N-acetyltransferase
MTSSGIDRAPVIEAERLRLRAHTASDFDACLSMWGDPDVFRYIGGRAFSVEEVWQRVQRYAGSWALLGFGFWIIEERTTGLMIGEVGLMDAKREIEPPFGEDREVGWALVPGAQGKGYAGEALAAALSWEQQVFNAPRLVAMIHPDNAPSIRLAVRHGFVERLRTTYKGTPTIQFERRKQA